MIFFLFSLPALSFSAYHNPKSYDAQVKKVGIQKYQDQDIHKTQVFQILKTLVWDCEILRLGSAPDQNGKGWLGLDLSMSLKAFLPILYKYYQYLIDIRKI